jgi:putative SOS response-associated peptidase YedK
MCASYEAKYKQEDISTLFNIQTPLFEFPFILFPRMDVPIIRLVADHKELLSARWGLLPSWVKDPERFRAATFNARAESISQTPSYRDAWRKRQRCILLVSRFFEWHSGADGKKTRYQLGLHDSDIFAVAGLWDHHEAEALESCTMMTTTANPLMARVHNKRPRMPVILKPEDYDSWLDPAVVVDERLFVPFDDVRMWARPVLG